MVRGFMNFSARRPKSYIHLDGFNTLIRYHGTKHYSFILNDSLRPGSSLFAHVAIDGLSIEFDMNDDRIPYYTFDVTYHVFPFTRSSRIYQRELHMRWLVDDLVATLISPMGVISGFIDRFRGISKEKITFRYLELLISTSVRLEKYHDRLLEIHSALYKLKHNDIYHQTFFENLNIFAASDWHFFDANDMKLLEELNNG